MMKENKYYKGFTENLNDSVYSVIFGGYYGITYSPDRVECSFKLPIDEKRNLEVLNNFVFMGKKEAVLLGDLWGTDPLKDVDVKPIKKK